MRKIFSLLLITIAIISCNKKDDPITPINQLPTATQTGENTFGCLLDGEAFLPRYGTNPLDCVYQYVNGGYYFTLQANKRDTSNNLIVVGINTNDSEIKVGQTISLIENEKGNTYGTFFFNTIFTFTSKVNSGELTITKLDMDNHIVSGTFWYDIIDSFGEFHQIREGRFDVKFSK